MAYACVNQNFNATSFIWDKRKRIMEILFMPFAYHIISQFHLTISISFIISKRSLNFSFKYIVFLKVNVLLTEAVLPRKQKRNPIV